MGTSPGLGASVATSELIVWPGSGLSVSYHGTKDTFAKVIAAEGYNLDKGKRFKYGRGNKYKNTNSQLK